MRRLRLVAAIVQLEIVADDGEQLEPVPTNPITVPATRWPPDLGALLAELEAQMNDGDEPPPPAPSNGQAATTAAD